MVLPIAEGGCGERCQDHVLSPGLGAESGHGLGYLTSVLPRCNTSERCRGFQVGDCALWSPNVVMQA